MGESRLLTVPDGLAGERLDIGLSRMLGLSRTKAAALVDDAGVTLDGRPGSRSDRLSGGEVLEVTLPRPPAPTPAIGIDQPEIPVLFEDADVVVIDKPVGMAAHPSPGWTGPTVTGSLAASGHHLSRLGPAERQGVVHRLDVGTSGVMVLAKSDLAYTDLKAQFKGRTVAKVYHALVQGHPDPSSGTIDAPIGRHPKHDYKWAVVAAGKPSVTHYETIEAFRHASLLRINLETGRTHQIRVHMAAVRHPCVGDITYGADPNLAKRLAVHRQWLHAVSLTFAHPGTSRSITVSSPYPADLQTALERVGG